MRNLIVMLSFLLSSPLVGAANSPSAQLYWTDSYSVDGQCYCDTTFDHELTDVTVDTPLGLLPIEQVCTDIRERFGQGRASERLYYNTVQCGHAPANFAADEIECPGFLTDASGAIQNYDCQASGARWNLDRLYGAADVDGDANTAANPFAVVVTDTGLPVCASASSDADGDGYGWEQGSSCAVRQSPAPIASDDGPVGRVIAGGGSLSMPGVAAALSLAFFVRIIDRRASRGGCARRQRHRSKSLCQS